MILRPLFRTHYVEGRLNYIIFLSVKFVFQMLVLKLFSFFKGYFILMMILNNYYPHVTEKVVLIQKLYSEDSKK